MQAFRLNHLRKITYKRIKNAKQSTTKLKRNSRAFRRGSINTLQIQEIKRFSETYLFYKCYKNALKKMRSKPLLTKDKTRADHYHKGAKDEAPKTKI